MTHSHSCNIRETSVQSCGTVLMDRVGESFEKFALAELSDDELELHIEDCQWQYLTAYERFQLHRNPHDREEALLHLHRMNEAIRARSPGVQAARHAAFERQLTEQVAYFASESAMQLGRVRL